MAPNLSEDEIDDLIYLARTGEDDDFTDMMRELATREEVPMAEILAASREEQSKATCLHMAAANGHAKTVTWILSRLPIQPKPKRKSQTSATVAPSEEEEQQSKPVENQKPLTPETYIDAANAFGNTALHWACLGGHLDIVKLLLSRGASPALANEKDQIPLDMAAFNQHMHVVDYFLAQSKDLEGDNAVAQGGDGGLAGGAQDLSMKGDDGDVEGSGDPIGGKMDTSGG